MEKAKFKNWLFQMVKNDYGFELYNFTSHSIKFSFYHLNSIYNSFCTSVYFRERWGYPSINWQYARTNKKIANYAKNIVVFMVEYYKKYGNIDWCIKEIEYYSKLADNVFNAKYNINVTLHTIN